MKKRKLLIRLVVLMAAMMCGLGARAQEAYACYTSYNTTLMFCYDDMRPARLGTTYDLNQIASNPGWYSDGTYENVTRVVFSSSFAAARPISTSSWFAGMENLETITGLNYLNTSEVIDMDGMFINTIKFTSLNLSSFNTSKVRNLSGMFAGCTGLTSLDLGGWNTSEVVSTLGMFDECSSLKSLDLSGWNTSKVNNMGFMFASCGELQTIYVGDEWSTASVTKSELMFADCFNLVGGQGTAYDINHIDVAYGHLDGGPSNPGYLTAVGTEAYAIYTLTNTTLTFYYDTQKLDRPGWGCSLNTGANDTRWDLDGLNPNVTKVVFDPSFAGARPTTTYDWFYMMEKLESIEGMEYLNTSAVTNMAYMFTGCKKLTSIDLSHFNTAQVTDMHNMFALCDLTYLDLSSFNTAQVTDMSRMFVNCSDLQTIYVGDGWSTSAVTSSSIMFDNCFNLVGGKGTAWNSSNPTDKAYAHIDGGTSNPGYLTDKNAAEAYAVYTSSNTTLTFYYDDQRSSRPGTTYDLNTGDTDAGWDTDGTKSHVTRVVFDPLFAAARPTTTYDWFYSMENLQTIEGLEYLNTSEVTSMAYMFLNCSQLTSLDLSHFNTAKVENMRSMFSRCTGLTSLDLSSWNTSRVTNMYFMFYNCSNLETIYVGRDWSTYAVTYSTQMFTGCTSLVGGQGTAYDANHADASYAHIDGGPSNPGYFTNSVVEAYTCYTPENTTLTFYYDTQRLGRSGTTYDLNTGNSDTAWETDGTNANVTQVVFDPSFAAARPTTTYSWFYGMAHLSSITGMEYLNTSEVTNMNWMFGDCAALRSLDLSHFNTSKVTNMTGMFRRCGNLRTIYVGAYWSTAAVTYSQNMFRDCTSLVGGQGTTFDANHTDKAYAHIDGGPSNPGYFTAQLEAYACFTSSNTTLSFYYDNQRSTRTGTTYDLNRGYNLPAWVGIAQYVSNVVFDPSFADARPTTTYSWFWRMNYLGTITGLNYLNTSEVTNMASMFWECGSLSGLDLNGFNTSKVTDMWSMFAECHELTCLDLSSFNTSNVEYMTEMFYSCSSLTTICAGDGWSTAAVMYSDDMFNGCTSLVGGQGTTYNANNPQDKTYAHIDGGPSNPGYFTENPAGLRGDVNGDHEVTISDAIMLINAILNDDMSGVNMVNADVNYSGTVDISDAIMLINYVLNETWP